jgi:hypothetical protein
MKNFPHQISFLPRLNRALGVFGDLINRRANIDSDAVVGDALARAGAYTFRYGHGRSIRALLAQEHGKPAGSQGTRACARDLRRFFRLLGFIRRDDGRWRIGNTGRAVMAADSLCAFDKAR